MKLPRQQKHYIDYDGILMLTLMDEKLYIPNYECIPLNAEELRSMMAYIIIHNITK